MKPKIFTFLLFAFVVSCSVFAQFPGPGSNWYFGQNAGCTWCTLAPNGDPVPLMDGQLVTNEGVATISDEQCNLIFYTDGRQVWNAMHQVMTNSGVSSPGGNLTGSSSSTQSGVIVPKPLDPNTYYVFTVDANLGSGGLAFSRVDMSLNGGLGDVDLAQKNVPLFNPSTEKIAAVAHANGSDIWVITHQWNNAQFNVYLVTNLGVQYTSPIINVVGQVHSGATWNTHGYMKASPNGGMLALGMESDGIYEIFQFNNSTGVLSNPIVLDDPNGSFNDCYGVEFSPSEQYLYGSERYGFDLHQFDVTTWSQASIMASHQIVAVLSSAHGGALQLAPDQKIYCARSLTDYLGRINVPDANGAACSYVDQAVYLSTSTSDPRDSREGLPTFISTFFVPAIIEFETDCDNDTTFFHIPNANGLDYAYWNFNWPSTDPAYQLTTSSPSAIFFYPQGGLYTVRLITQRDNLFDTTFVEVPFAQTPFVDLGPDRTLCEDEIVTYDLSYNDSAAIDGLCEYEWTAYLGTQTFYDTLPTYLIDKPGTYSVTVTSDSICGPTVEEVVIEYNNMVAQLGVDVTSGLCQGDSYLLDATYTNTTYGNTTYQWSTGHNTSSINVGQTGTYSVTMTNGSVAAGYCTDIDSVYVEFDAPLTMPFDNEVDNLCVGETMTLDAENPDANYVWSTGLFTQTIDVLNPGMYSVTIYNACGTISDTVSLVSLDVPPVNLGPDITICEGVPHVIDAYISNCTYLWSTNDVMPQLSVDTAGLYSVTVTNECGDAVDNIYVYADQELVDFSLGNDTSVCIGFELDCGYPNIEYYWSTNETTQSIIIHQSDDYGVDISNQCGTYSDVIHIDVIDMNLDLGGDQVFCPGSSLTLDAGNSGAVYFWSDGSTDQTNQVSQAGEVWVQVTNPCGDMFDTVQVSEYDLSLNLGPDTAICDIDDLVLDAEHPGAEFAWSTGATSQSIDVLQTGNYAVTVSHFCGDLTDEISVDINPTPVVDFGADTLYFVNGQDVALDPHALGTTYAWSNGTSDSILIVPTTGAGTYLVTVTNQFGCAGEGSVVVDFMIGINEYGVEQKISLFPNPAKDKICISVQGIRIANLQILNAQGKLVKVFDNEYEVFELNTRSFSEGVYFIRLFTKQNEIFTRSFLVVK